jgi:hypothetical protein
LRTLALWRRVPSTRPRAGPSRPTACSGETSHRGWRWKRPTTACASSPSATRARGRSTSASPTSCTPTDFGSQCRAAGMYPSTIPTTGNSSSCSAPGRWTRPACARTCWRR